MKLCNFTNRRTNKYVEFHHLCLYAILYSLTSLFISEYVTYAEDGTFYSLNVFIYTFISLSILCIFISLICIVICTSVIDGMNLPDRASFYLSIFGITCINIFLQLSFMYSFIWWIDGVDWIRVLEIVLTFVIPGLLVALV